MKKPASVGSKFSELLIDLRTGSLMSQQEMADHLGVPRGTYSNWERGDKVNFMPNRNSIKKLMNAYPTRAIEILELYQEHKKEPPKSEQQTLKSL